MLLGGKVLFILLHFLCVFTTWVGNFMFLHQSCRELCTKREGLCTKVKWNLYSIEHHYIITLYCIYCQKARANLQRNSVFLKKICHESLLTNVIYVLNPVPQCSLLLMWLLINLREKLTRINYLIYKAWWKNQAQAS